MKINVDYQPSEWTVNWFDSPWLFECLHPSTHTEPQLSFDAETVSDITVCNDTDCLEVLEEL